MSPATASAPRRSSRRWSRIPKVSEAAVVGYPHDIKGQGIYAYVTLMTGENPTEDLRKELVQWVRKEIGPIASPDLIQFSPGLPKTRSGKIMRRILRKIAEDDYGKLGDTSTFADPTVVDDLVDNRQNNGRVREALMRDLLAVASRLPEAKADCGGTAPPIGEFWMCAPLRFGRRSRRIAWACSTVSLSAPARSGALDLENGEIKTSSRTSSKAVAETSLRYMRIAFSCALILRSGSLRSSSSVSEWRHASASSRGAARSGIWMRGAIFAAWNRLVIGQCRSCAAVVRAPTRH